MCCIDAGVDFPFPFKEGGRYVKIWKYKFKGLVIKYKLVADNIGFLKAYNFNNRLQY